MDDKFIKQRVCYTTIAMDGSPLDITIQEMVEDGSLDKHEDVIFLTKERYEALMDNLETFIQEPYHTDVFPEITTEQINHLHELCLKWWHL